jgi:hypothetical protein
VSKFGWQHRSSGMTRAMAVPETVTIHVPFRIVKRGGRKDMRLPEGAALPRQADNALVKALARAFRWKRMLDSGEFATIGELAQREGIAVSYLTRVLRLTLLAPAIVEAILDGRQGPKLTLARLREPFPVEWDRQTVVACGATNRVRLLSSRLSRDTSRTPSALVLPHLRAGGEAPSGRRHR